MLVLAALLDRLQVLRGALLVRQVPRRRVEVHAARQRALDVLREHPGPAHDQPKHGRHDRRAHGPPRHQRRQQRDDSEDGGLAQRGRLRGGGWVIRQGRLHTKRRIKVRVYLGDIMFF